MLRAGPGQAGPGQAGGPVSDPRLPDPRLADAQSLADLASSVAQEAGELLMSRYGRVSVVHTKSSPTDVVTEMDRAAEQLIRDRLQAARPGDAILGTVNYLYGLPDWAVSIAAEVTGVVVAGAVCVPLRRSLFSATLGGGAWLESAWQDGRQRLACNSGVALADALVATGFGYPAVQRAEQGQVVAAVLPMVRDIRRAGAAAADLCSLAAGRVDAYYEQGVHEWDIAAGGLIAREAGAMMGGLNGQPAGEAMTLAADPALFTALHDLLASLDAGRLPPD